MAGVVPQRRGDHAKGLLCAERAKVINRKIYQHVSLELFTRIAMAERAIANSYIILREKHEINRFLTIKWEEDPGKMTAAPDGRRTRTGSITRRPLPGGPPLG